MWGVDSVLIEAHLTALFICFRLIRTWTQRRVDSDVERSADTELQGGVIGERETVDRAISNAAVQVATERAMLGAVQEAEDRVIGDAMEREAEREAGRKTGTAVEREAEGEKPLCPVLQIGTVSLLRLEEHLWVISGLVNERHL